MMNCADIHHSSSIILEVIHVDLDPWQHDSEHDRLLGGGFRCAALGTALGIGRSTGPSKNPRHGHAHQRRIGHLAGHRAAVGRGTSFVVGIARFPSAGTKPGWQYSTKLGWQFNCHPNKHHPNEF